MINRSELSEVGTVNKPHGHAGEMSVSLACELDPADIRFLMMDVDGIFVPFMVTSSRPRGSEAWLITVEGIESDTEAAVYTGARLYALTDTLRRLTADSQDADGDEDGYVGADSLIGYSVEDDGRTLGVISDIDTSTLNALFVVTAPDGGTLLVPVADEFITDIDDERRVLFMSLPAGLADL